jgi:hypothetical protein
MPQYLQSLLVPKLMLRSLIQSRHADEFSCIWTKFLELFGSIWYSKHEYSISISSPYSMYSHDRHSRKPFARLSPRRPRTTKCNYLSLPTLPTVYPKRPKDPKDPNQPKQPRNPRVLITLITLITEYLKSLFYFILHILWLDKNKFVESMDLHLTHVS